MHSEERKTPDVSPGVLSFFDFLLDGNSALFFLIMEVASVKIILGMCIHALLLMFNYKIITYILKIGREEEK